MSAFVLFLFSVSFLSLSLCVRRRVLCQTRVSEMGVVVLCVFASSAAPFERDEMMMMLMLKNLLLFHHSLFTLFSLSLSDDDDDDDARNDDERSLLFPLCFSVSLSLSFSKEPLLLLRCFYFFLRCGDKEG